ncbi:MAG: hypothetical protein SGI77_08345 [Pirellulaceae bacterium]|nr:hypothetical protein [Pirellulaceae bacterium]
MISPRLAFRLGLIAGLFVVLANCDYSHGEEPANQFIERLREERLFDHASKYLDIYGKKGWLPETMVRDAPLERLMIIQDSLATSRTTKERDERLAALENGFRDFLASAKDHPRRSEAGLRFGTLMLDHGQREIKKLDEPNQSDNANAIRKAARDAFTQSEAAFKKTQEGLVIVLKEMAGAKIAASDTEKIALRKRYQGEYRQSQILQGLVLKLIATTYPTDDKLYQDWLKKAETQLSEVISKATSATEIGAKTLSRLYRGEVQALQGKIAPALESYTPVADNEEDGIFRVWRVQATAAMIRLLGSEAGGSKFDDAIKRGVDLLKKLDKNELMNPESLDLQLAISQVRLAYSAAVKGKKGSETTVKGEQREAREMLNVIARRPGDHQVKAKKLLSELGIEVIDPNESKLPVVRTFADAFKEAKIRLERAESSTLSVEILKTRIKETSGADKVQVESELKLTEENARRDRDQALQLLRRALHLYRPDDPRDDLLTARFYIAYLLVKQDRFWESVAVSDFVARSGPGTDTGLKATGFALFGYRKIVESLPADRQMSVIGSLEALAQFMQATWPEAEETQQATLTLLQHALRNQKWDEAERFLSLMPKSGDQSNATRRDLGYVLWIQYLISLDAQRKAGKAEGLGDLALRDRAERLLSEGWEALQIVTLDQRAVEAACALASLYLRTDRLDKAEAILYREKIGPIAVIANKSGPVKDATVRLEVHRLTLQSKVMAAASGSKTLEPSEVESLVNEMQAAAGKNTKLLTNTLLVLAKDLQDQLSAVQNDTNKAKLAGGIQVLLTQLASVSKDAGMLDWAGTTMWQLAAGLSKKPGSSAIMKKLNAEAIQVFQKMLDMAAKDPKFLDAIQRVPDDILLKQALAYRGTSEYQKAADSLIKILKGNSNQLTAQVEAARNYQEWATAKDGELLKKAIYGVEPDRRQKNIVWGWGQISKALISQMANSPELQTIFFDARLQLATCRRQIALSMPAGELRDKTLEQALNDIRQTYLFYPEFGGGESKNDFEKLVRSLQKDRGKENVGLKEFDVK